MKLLSFEKKPINDNSSKQTTATNTLNWMDTHSDLS